jgi:glucose-1-phosphatase
VALHPKIKNIIFDLGGVIINLNTDKTYQQFSRLSGIGLEELKSKSDKSAFFDLYEKGLLTDQEFRNQLRLFLKCEASDSEIDTAWNAMLLDIPQQRIQLLKQLRSNYKLFLLSNTNNIHLQCFTEIVKDTTGLSSLSDCFDRDYYSHLMKMRKPDAEIFQYVLNENNLKPDETLFLDDNQANLRGAASVGIQTFHVAHPDLIFSLFHEVKL